MNVALISTLTVIASLSMASSAQAAAMSYVSIFNGGNIVDGEGNPNPIDSPGQGFATFELNEAMDELSYNFTIGGLGIDSVLYSEAFPDAQLDYGDGLGTITKIHVHEGAPNEKSPFHVLNIFGPEDDADAVFSNLSPTSVTVRGVWSDADSPCDSDLTSDCNLDNGPTKRLSDYLGALMDGNLYVNIHTETVGSGEIRGQIEQIPLPPRQEPVPTPEPGKILGLVSVLVLVGFNVRKKKN